MRDLTFYKLAIAARLVAKNFKNGQAQPRPQWLTEKYCKAFKAYEYFRGDQKRTTTGQMLNLWE